MKKVLEKPVESTDQKKQKAPLVASTKMLTHTGFSNYIETSEGVVYHPSAKIVKRFSHACGLNKMM